MRPIFHPNYPPRSSGHPPSHQCCLEGVKGEGKGLGRGCYAQCSTNTPKPSQDPPHILQDNTPNQCIGQLLKTKGCCNDSTCWFVTMQYIFTLSYKNVCLTLKSNTNIQLSRIFNLKTKIILRVSIKYIYYGVRNRVFKQIHSMGNCSFFFLVQEGGSFKIDKISYKYFEDLS